MKKLMILAAMALMGTAAQAQVHHTETTSKFSRPAETLWYVRAGAGLDLDFETSSKPTFGYNVGFGFNRTLGHKGAYWGMELGLASRNGNFAEDVWTSNGTVEVTTKRNVLNVYYQPLWFGWKFPVSDNIAVDPHLSGFVDYSIAGDIDAIDDGYTNIDGQQYWIHGKQETNSKLGIGAQIGCGLWINKKYNVDLSARADFLGGVDEGHGKLMLSFGYAF